MQKLIVIFLLGFIIGGGLFYVLSIFKEKKDNLLNSSPECGVITPFKYCGSNDYLCVVNCNICGCDKPQCEPRPNCTS